MTRTAHDQFAKQYLEELLSPLGQVETSRDVVSEVRQVDVYFVPFATPATEPENLGALGQMARQPCLFEVFRNPPTPFEVRNCKLKLYSVKGERFRQARREKTALSESELPSLWILSPSCSARVLTGFGATPSPEGNWTEGFYFMPEFERTALVAIDQLPVNPNTLWLRVLGRGATQEQAVNELLELPPGNPFRRNLLEVLANWRINVEVRQNIDEDDRELIMNLSPAYLRWREEAVQEGRQEGLQEGRQEERREMIENLLQVRFGDIDEELSSVIEPLLQLPTQELTRLLLTLSREELLQRFGTQG